MITAVDTSVLLDILCDDPVHVESSGSALRKAMAEGRLIACECVVAELRPALTESDLRDFLADWGIEFVPSTLETALLAGAHFDAYLKRNKRGLRIIPDFLIGAHARLLADRLLARDRGYLRDYFKPLKLMEP